MHGKIDQNERLQNSKDSLKACFENVKFIEMNVKIKMTLLRTLLQSKDQTQNLTEVSQCMLVTKF